jgi:hypothetical protein
MELLEYLKSLWILQKFYKDFILFLLYKFKPSIKNVNEDK